MKNLKRTAFAGLIVAGLFTATACAQGPADTPAGPDDPAEVRSVKVIVSTIVDTSPVFIAEDRGLFEERGLDVEITAAPNPGARIPSLVSGAAAFTMVGTADVVQAASAGIQLRVTGQTAQTTDDPQQDTGKVYVAADSDIKTAADLNGRTVAVGGLGGGGELSLRAALDMEGADSNQIKFLEVPFDSMVNALETGQVDAISGVSPFTIAAEEAGARWLMSPGATAMPGASQQLVVTTEEYLSANQETVDLFMDALNEAIEYAGENPDAVRDILPKFSKTPAELAQKMVLPVYTPDVTAEKIKKWSDLMFEYGFIKNEIDVDTLLAVD
ncbi:ABC transporter substrate-binding protein [Ruicaihuangia caeni]|uniref:ABC transporter substrate-binding protein n=1 Tax=Ruicaihuangia caeni TaxID=3042517 RepID=A0AAW6T5X3_9MICO|nr:ABC transporter substrate-binding protein [Klugiella sp. YN-L-19]MDI2099230.1 ABC transporter substrate-binding protein [Klugiella sp. YN-L-19]